MNKVNLKTRLGIHSLLVGIQLTSASLIVLIGLIFFLELTKPEQTYLVSDLNGNLTNITALDEPNVSPSTLLRWVSLAVTGVYTLDFVDYQQTLDNLSQYFTKAGYQNFLTAANERVQTIIAQKLVVTAVVAGTPVIVQEGIMHGFYFWQIQVPILLSYQGASEKSTKQTLAIKLLVMRVPTKEALTGIGIAQIQDNVMFNN